MIKCSVIFLIGIVLLLSGCGVHRQSYGSAPSMASFPEGAYLSITPSPYPEYDQQIVQAVVNRWYDILDSTTYSGVWTGRVVVTFHLMEDGQVTDFVIAENTASEIDGLICQKAVTDPAPYPRWPQNMRALVGKDFRELTFAFDYKPASPVKTSAQPRQKHPGPVKGGDHLE